MELIERRLRRYKTNSEIRGLPAPQPKQQEFIDNIADIVIFGGAAGSGKTASLLIDFAQDKFVSNPNYRACILRRTYPEINSPGGLADESKNLYIPLGSTLTKNPYEWTFPRNSKIAFRHLQHDKDIYGFQGSQITRIGFDELVHFTEEQFFYLLSRNRSTCGIRPQVRCTCNPDAESWVAKMISWWIDPVSGLPIKERSGIVRYFIRFQQDLIWGDSDAELKAKYPNLEPKSFSFIPATIYDNQILLKENPSYLSNLMALHPVEKARLLEGNWKIKYEAGSIFDRSWFTIVDRPTQDGAEVRFWDLAATAKEVAKKTSFYTCGIKLKKIAEVYYVMDVVYEQKKPGEVEELIRLIALQDGKQCRIRWELEGGSAGKLFADMLLQKLSGFNAKSIKPIGDKVTRSYNSATAANQGRVSLVRSPWNDQFLNAVQSFDGSPKPLVNDIVDAFNGGYHELSQDKKILYDLLYS